MKLFCFRTITTKSRAPNVVVPNLFKIDEHSAPLLDPDTANDVEDDGLDKKTKPIPFLIRNTTADGMPISIGSLRAVSTPAFSSFNPFIKRLPPPKKYIFEPRQVLPGDVVDPYNYLRALFRGEVILTSDRLPTFASPRVWGMTTASTLAKVPGAMYTSRSPQGFNPLMFSKKKTPSATTTTTTTRRPASFFGSIGLASKGAGSDVEKKPLPVGMLGTPAPDFKNFNFKKFVEEMKRQKPMGGPISVPGINTIASSSSASSRSPVIDTFINNVKNKNLPTIDTIMDNFKQKNGGRLPSLQNVVNTLKSKNVPSMDDIMNKLHKQNSVTFPALPAVPGKPVESSAPLPAEAKNTFTPVAAVPVVSSESKMPSFQHFPSSTTEKQRILRRKNKAISFEPRVSVDSGRKGSALQKLKDLLTPPKPKVTTESLNIAAALEKNPDLYKTSFSPSTPRSLDILTSTPRVRPRLPHGTVRAEINTILQSRLTTTSTPRPRLLELVELRAPPTAPPPAQQTTSRAEVLALLKQFLQSVKPATTPATTTTTTTARTTLETTTMSPTTALSSRLFKSPSLRFDAPAPAPPHYDNPTRLNIDLSSVSPLGPGRLVTTASPINPRSPFPNMEPPQHDVLKSHVFLADPRDTVVQTSTVHPLSPFQHLEPPAPDTGSLEFSEQDELSLFSRPGEQTAGFLAGTLASRAIPRSDPGTLFPLLPYDPARPHLPPQSPTEQPGQFKLFLGSGDLSRPRPQRKLSSGGGHRQPAPRTRLVAPQSRLPATNRRLIMDGPTESSLTPLEVLARGTVPTLRPDSTIFGTPRSRQLEAQSPLEQLSATLQESIGRGLGFTDEVQPVERSRFQRRPDNSGNQEGKKVRIPGASYDYSKLPGVKTGTTAVGLVEHKEGQPVFHVPVFTTPIPRNGQFLNLNQNPLRGFQTGLKRISSALADSVKLPNIPSPREGFQRLKKMLGGAAEVRDIQLTPAPRHLHRRLDTFSRYTRFGTGEAAAALCSLNVLGLCFVIHRVFAYFMF